ncbi:hypothetical protein [Cyclobacterium marinum]|uniref:hypothetical protein n=1 Tax=Cyclobacterium marinum TaxID=104 RepID=UPI0030D9EBED
MPFVLSKPALIFNSLRACPEAEQLRGKNEQVEIRITIGENDFVSIVAEKEQQYRQNQIALHVFNQGFTALATKVTPLWGFGICKLYVFVWKYLYR